MSTAWTMQSARRSSSSMRSTRSARALPNRWSVSTSRPPPLRPELPGSPPRPRCRPGGAVVALGEVDHVLAPLDAAHEPGEVGERAGQIACTAARRSTARACSICRAWPSRPLRDPASGRLPPRLAVSGCPTTIAACAPSTRTAAAGRRRGPPAREAQGVDGRPTWPRSEVKPRTSSGPRASTRSRPPPGRRGAAGSRSLAAGAPGRSTWAREGEVEEQQEVAPGRHRHLRAAAAPPPAWRSTTSKPVRACLSVL